MASAALPPAPTVEDGLARLLEVEARLAERLATAEAEARRIREAAREAVKRQGTTHQGMAADDAAALVRRVEAERDAEIRSLEASTADRCRRLASLSAATVDSLAALAVDQLLGIPRGNLP